MSYCENCGTELPAGARFCEECGVQVDSYNESVVSGPTKENNGCHDYRSSFIGNWRDKWANAAHAAGGNELGIILTDVNALATQLSCSTTDLSEIIGSYIASAANRGVNYHLLDLGSNGISDIDGKNVQATVNLL